MQSDRKPLNLLSHLRGHPSNRLVSTQSTIHFDLAQTRCVILLFKPWASSVETLLHVHSLVPVLFEMPESAFHIQNVERRTSFLLGDL